jgi:putative hemolysin
MKTLLLVLSVFCVVIVLTGCTSDSRDHQDAAAYCQKNGGKMETRYPFFDTNSQNPLKLAGSLDVCTFTAPDQSRIFITVDALYTDKPTIAASAYLSKPPVDQAPASGNPSSAYCTKLGGSDLFGGANAPVGGWANKDGSDVVSLCVFPDLSAIDSWGLTYHAGGVVRGTDLAPLLRYKLDQSRKPFQP